MARFTNPLSHVQVAAPCKADWDGMIGSDQVRFCGQCQLNVYNLSGMRRAEAESLIAGTEGRLCVRFYRRVDGSILTRDCPVGLRAIHEKVSYWTKAITAAALTFLATLGFYRLLPDVQPFPPQRTMGIMALPIDRQRDAIPPPIPKLPFTSGHVVIKATSRKIKR
ncbi:MAG: hypothetical protein ABR607_01700 [Pyrinomonadaceae bacterium]